MVKMRTKRNREIPKTRSFGSFRAIQIPLRLYFRPVSISTIDPFCGIGVKVWKEQELSLPIDNRILPLCEASIQ